MANDIYTMTPGSAVSDTVQALLQRKREEQRQMILDQLTMEKFRQDKTEQDRRFGLDTDAEKRHALDSEQNRKESGERVFRSQAESLPYAGGEMSDEFANSELGRELQRRQMITRRPQASVSTSATMALPPDGATPEQLEEWAQLQEQGVAGGTDTTTSAGGGWQWRGQTDFQKAEDAKRRAEEFASSGATTERNPVSLVAKASGAGVQLPAQAIPNTTRVLGPQHAGKTFEGRVGDENVEIGYPPVGPSGLVTPKLHQLYENGRWIGSRVFTPEEAQAFNASNPNIELRERNTVDNQLPGGMAKELADAREAFVFQSGQGVGFFGGESDDLKAARSRYQTALGVALQAYNGDPGAKEEAIFIATHPELYRLPLQQIIQHPKFAEAVGYDPKTLTPQETVELDNLLNIIRGANMPTSETPPASAPAAPIVSGGRGGAVGPRR